MSLNFNSFLHISTRLMVAIILCMSPKWASAQELNVALVAPQEGSFGTLGQQLRSGFYLHQETTDYADDQFTLSEYGEVCDTHSGQALARKMVEDRVDIVFGFLCVESLLAALPILSEQNIAVVNLNIRSDIVRDEAARLGWKLFSLAPRASDEANFATEYILQNWGTRAVALIEDGTIANRQLTDSVRLQLDNAGFDPVVLDNFRPGQDKQFGLVRRLAQSKITHVFIGGSRADTSIIADNAEEIGLELTFLGGDLLHAADEGVALKNDVLAILAPIALVGPNAQNIRQDFDLIDVFPDRFPLLGYAAAQIAMDLSSQDFTVDLRNHISELMRKRRFETLIGPIQFNDIGERQQQAYRTMIWRSGSFVLENTIN